MPAEMRASPERASPEKALDDGDHSTSAVLFHEPRSKVLGVVANRVVFIAF
jgi:hypothetical protein